MGEITFAQILVIVLGLVAIIKYVLDTYKGIDKPNVKQDLEIRSIQENCVIRSTNVDEKFSELKNDIHHLKNNHLRHIETDVKELGHKMVRIETKLDILLPNKKE